jgi:Rrf2 family nitric oxide-sensitive transcriptional repressor
LGVDSRCGQQYSGYAYPDIENTILLSQTTEYALRAVVWLASNPEEPQTTEQIAKATRVPSGYLSKVLQSLGRGGLVHAQRGKHGGFLLVRHPDQITILQVVNAVDPLKRILECPLGLKSHGKVLCPLHKSLDEAMCVVETSFRNTTLADLLTTPAASKPLCEISAVQVA